MASPHSTQAATRFEPGVGTQETPAAEKGRSMHTIITDSTGERLVGDAYDRAIRQRETRVYQDAWVRI